MVTIPQHLKITRMDVEPTIAWSLLVNIAAACVLFAHTRLERADPFEVVWGCRLGMYFRAATSAVADVFSHSSLSHSLLPAGHFVIRCPCGLRRPRSQEQLLAVVQVMRRLTCFSATCVFAAAVGLYYTRYPSAPLLLRG